MQEGSLQFSKAVLQRNGSSVAIVARIKEEREHNKNNLRSPTI